MILWLRLRRLMYAFVVARCFSVCLLVCFSRFCVFRRLRSLISHSNNNQRQCKHSQFRHNHKPRQDKHQVMTRLWPCNDNNNKQRNRHMNRLWLHAHNNNLKYNHKYNIKKAHTQQFRKHARLSPLWLCLHMRLCKLKLLFLHNNHH